MKKTSLTTTFALLAMASLIPLHAFAKEKGGDDDKHMKRKEMMEQKWKEKDKDGDGALDKSEFMSGAEERFKKADADGDGKVTKEEMKKAHEARKAKWKERKDKMEQHKSGGEHGEGDL